MNNIRPVVSEAARNFVKVVKKFFEPLGKRPHSFFVWPIIIITVCWFYVATGISELARNNSDEALFIAADALVLGAEEISPIGPHFAQEDKSNARVLRAYIEWIEERHLAALLRRLYPKKTPRQRLLPLLARLEEPPEDQKRARELLWNVGEQIKEFYEDSEKLSSRKATWFKAERIPEDLVTDLDEALAESQKLSKKLEEVTTVDNAFGACQANRRTMLLLFLGRLGYGSPEKIKQFLSITEKTLDYKIRLAATVEDPKVKQLLLAWAGSEQRRIDILHAMLRDDMGRVRELLRKAIERAYEDKAKAGSGE